MSYPVITKATDVVNWCDERIMAIIDDQIKNSLDVSTTLDRIEKLTGARPSKRITQQRVRRHREMRLRQHRQNENPNWEMDLNRIAANLIQRDKDKEQQNQNFHIDESVKQLPNSCDGLNQSKRKNYTGFRGQCTPAKLPHSQNSFFQPNFQSVINHGSQPFFDNFRCGTVPCLNDTSEQPYTPNFLESPPLPALNTTSIPEKITQITNSVSLTVLDSNKNAATAAKPLLPLIGISTKYIRMIPPPMAQRQLPSSPETTKKVTCDKIKNPLLAISRRLISPTAMYKYHIRDTVIYLSNRCTLLTYLPEYGAINGVISFQKSDRQSLADIYKTLHATKADYESYFNIETQQHVETFLHQIKITNTLGSPMVDNTTFTYRQFMKILKYFKTILSELYESSDDAIDINDGTFYGNSVHVTKTARQLEILWNLIRAIWH